MTGVLTAAVVLLAVLTLLTLALLLAVVRRLREHETRLAELAAGVGAGGMPDVIAPAGHPVTGLDAELPALVGFFSPGCDACHERLPDFRKAAAGHAGGTLAVVVADGKDPAPLVAELGGNGSVVLEDPGGPLATAFAVRGFPAFAVVGTDGRISASGYELPAPAR